MNAIDAARNAGSLIQSHPDLYESSVRSLIGFFRNYADKFHHFKEEDILFPEMSKKSELMADGIVKEMFDNHEDFREMIREIAKANDAKRYNEAQKFLEAYCNALLDHIAVENDELFVTAESLFTPAELKMIVSRFSDCDRELGDDVKKQLEEAAADIRKKILFAD